MKAKLIAAVLFLAAIAVSQISDAASDEPPKAQTTTLIDHFHEVKFGTFENISDAVEPYFRGQDVEGAIRVLSENGFESRIISDLSTIRIDEIDKKLGTEKKIISTRGAGARFWRFLTEYKIYLSVKNSKIVRTTAVVDSLRIFP